MKSSAQSSGSTPLTAYWELAKFCLSKAETQQKNPEWETKSKALILNHYILPKIR